MSFEVAKEKVPCDDCSEINLVTTTFGHSEWEEPCDYACAHCGAHMGIRRAVSVGTQKIARTASRLHQPSLV